jgi:hypothetical protein
MSKIREILNKFNINGHAEYLFESGLINQDTGITEWEQNPHYSGNYWWAGVCYLTPDAPISGGTALYMYKETKRRSSIDNIDYREDARDYTKWEVVDRIGNIYNRLILYPGNLYHASMDYFGKDLHSGRLFQTFFFNTRY